MKEKIGIENLIELLNEYNCKVLKHTDKWKEKNGRLIMEIDYNHSRSFNSDLYICSLRYGFIKWLVENDKIDTDAYKTVYSGDLDKRKTLTMSSGGDEFYQVTEHGVYESLIMLLSISDTPIEDLISYLK